MRHHSAPSWRQRLWLVGAALISCAVALQAQEPKPVPAPQPRTAMAAEPDEEEAVAAAPVKLDCAWLPFPDKEKFKVLGLWWFEENTNLWRMPKANFDSLP